MKEKIKLTFLGTSDAVPSASRNHSAILLSYYGENILVDCGEGTQRQFRKARLNPCKIDKILITHWHGDHVLGLPGLMQTLALIGYNRKLEIYGPRGTKDKIKKMFETFVFVDNIDFKIKEVPSSGNFFETDDFILSTKKMIHKTVCNAYCFKEKDKIKIDKQKLKKTGLPEGIHIQKLKECKDIIFRGKKYKSKDMTFVEPGKKVCFVLDTRDNERIVDFVKDSDLFVCEACFSSELEEHAKEHTHLTASQAGEIAKRGNVGKLVLTHISQRYENNFKLILEEAKRNFKNVHLVRDLDVLRV